jgi:peptidylprolyl isomerase
LARLERSRQPGRELKRAPGNRLDRLALGAYGAPLHRGDEIVKRTTLLGIALFLCLAPALPAAADPTPTAPPNKIPPGAKILSQPSGLQYVDLVAGQGPQPNKGDLCIVHYTAWLEDGREVGTSTKPKPIDPRDPSKGEKVLPFGFKLGSGQVIPGWDEGVSTMKEGGSRLLLIPPQLAYGSKGAGGVIPPDSRLTFRVDLIKVKAEPGAPQPAGKAPDSK